MKHGFLDKYSDLSSPLHSLSATAKVIVFLVLIIVCVTTAPSAYLSFAGYLTFLAVCLVVSRVPVIHVLRLSLVVVPFLAMAALSIPFFSRAAEGRNAATAVHPGLIVFQGIALKSFISVCSLILLSAITPFPHFLSALRKLGTPRLLISLMSFTYRYLFLMVEEFERMVRARDARCYGGGWLWQTRVVGRMVGTFFVRSYERAERVYNAMAARGFDGRVPVQDAQPMGLKDYLFVLLSAAFFVGCRMFLSPGWTY